jgi:hypothetical protein
VSLVRIGGLAIVAACGIGCGTSSEPSSLFLTVKIALGTLSPDELRVSVFDEHEAIFVDERLPSTGTLQPLSATTLGTATVFLSPVSTMARVDVRGVSDGRPQLRGTSAVPLVVRGGQLPLTITLNADPALDGDGDGVPDSIDNCPRWYNADQADANGDGVGNGCAPGGDAGLHDGANAGQSDASDEAAAAQAVESGRTVQVVTNPRTYGLKTPREPVEWTFSSAPPRTA